MSKTYPTLDNEDITIYAICHRQIECEPDMQEGLMQCSKNLVGGAVVKYGSLRKAATALQLSAAYLSRISNGQLAFGMHRFRTVFRTIYPDTSKEIEKSKAMTEWLETPYF